MIAVLWALLGVMGYIAVAAVAFVYREDTWMRLLPSRLRHVAHKDRLAGVFAASTGLYENPDEDPASPTSTGPGGAAMRFRWRRVPTPADHCFREDGCGKHHELEAVPDDGACCCCGQPAEVHTGCDCE